jgi:putative transposase
MYHHLGKTDAERQNAYRTLFRGRMPERDLAAIREVTNKAWVLGDHRFKTQIEAETGRRPESLGRGGDRKSVVFRESQNQRN